jgi:malonyl-CoA O-methyltransferase
LPPPEPRFHAPDPRDVDPRAVRRAFGRAAATYDAAAAMQREVGARMASRLDYIRIAPRTILDAGCGTGEAVGELAARYAGARVVALDAALPMVETARDRALRARSLLRRLLPEALGGGGAAAPFFVCGDFNSLPLSGVAFDMVWSNLALQWANDLPRAFAEIRRIMKVGGLFTFTTFGPDTLKEIRVAFARADGHTHTNRFTDMHDIGDMLVGAGFADPVMDMEQLTLTYADAVALMRELKQIGATNATRGRPHGLMGRGRWQRALAALEAMRKDGRIPATYEVVYGHAWKGEPRFSADGHPIVKLSRPGR